MKYVIKCLECGKIYPEDRYITKCVNGCDSLLRTEYNKKSLEIENLPGLWKYINWLPVNNIDKRILKEASTFLMYNSKKLAKYLGLKNLVICLNVYRPGENGLMATGSFKDLEAMLSIQRLLSTRESGKPFIISSDGNIAIAFIYHSNIFKYPIILIVTEEGRNKRIWSYNKKNPYVSLISLKKGSDYYDCIKLADELADDDRFILEGGTYSVARRDGVGTIMLEATIKLGHLPDHYFQALGSGPGAIAAYEASLRLAEDGRYGKNLPKIHGSQNYPFVPMHDAWQKHSRIIDKKYQDESAKDLIRDIYAHVLSNRYPCYSAKGGVFDALSNTSGHFYSVINNEAKKAQKLFKKLEGYDIEPPAAVTVSSLIQAIEQKRVSKNDSILLNITGGGRNEIKKERFKIESMVSAGKNYNIKEITEKILNKNITYENKNR